MYVPEATIQNEPSRSESPGSHTTVPDCIDDPDDGDFARLVPVNRQACVAFDEVAERMRTDPEWGSHARQFTVISDSKISFSTEFSGSETDSTSGTSNIPVWTGYYRLNLEIPPKKFRFGWIVGSSPEEADILLTTKKQQYRVRGKHARLTYNLSSYAFLVVADFGRSVMLDGKDEVRNAQRVLWSNETGITFGDLAYKLVRTDLSERLLREQLSVLREELGASRHEPPAYLAPTPSNDDYEYSGYIVKGVFAQGATCSVSAGLDKRTGVAVAVKKMVRNSRNFMMVKNEVEIMKFVGSHPRICHLIADLYSRGDIDNMGSNRIDEIYLIYSPLADEKFTDLIKHPRRTYEEHVMLFKQGLEGIAYLHQKGLMHRDIKPGNMAVVPSTPPRLVLLDLGVATFEETSLEHMAGTIPYLAPEVMSLKRGQSHRPYGKLVDIWGYGLSFYQLFCRRTCWWNEISQSVLRKIMSDISAKEQYAALSLVQAMLQWEPKDRISAVDALSTPVLQAVDSGLIVLQREGSGGKRLREA